MQTALLYASVNVTDDQGTPATTLQLDPLMPGCMFPVVSTYLLG
jgi:hypothetical protein